MHSITAASRTVFTILADLGAEKIPRLSRRCTITVVVVSHALWEQRFGSDPAVVGTNLTLNGHEFTVVGIAPAGFTGLLAGFTADVWMPVSMHRALNPGLIPDERHMH
jgi:hypothetical protein